MSLWRFKHFCMKTTGRSFSRKCIIYHSNSADPYENLAFEDWMYERVDFKGTNCLLIWRNVPSVVIGRHQNPWKECDVTKLQNDGINVCRRKSGGGAVYHDLGNVNFTFFTDRKNYNRTNNLKIILSGLLEKWPLLNVKLNNRDDIVLNEEFKVSGSSAKLGRNVAYHHCTLLVNSNKADIENYLLVKQPHILCKATESIRSNVLNLEDENRNINFKNVCDAVTAAYSNEFKECKSYSINTNDEVLLPGVTKMKKGHKSWEWVYGKTPDFSIKKQFEHHKFGLCIMELTILKGKINNIEIILERIWKDSAIISHLKFTLISVRFDKNEIMNALKFTEHISNSSKEFYHFLCDCILSLL